MVKGKRNSDKFFNFMGKVAVIVAVLTYFNITPQSVKDVPDEIETSLHTQHRLSDVAYRETVNTYADPEIANYKINSVRSIEERIASGNINDPVLTYYNYMTNINKK